MGKLVMERNTSDNKYLHRDFHVSADAGLAYVGRRWGEAGVKDYLQRFACSWYSPLIDEIKAKGLGALREHLEKIYNTEETPDVLHIDFNAAEMRVRIDRCPAVSYMRSAGTEPSPWYGELTSTVNRVIAEKSGFGFEMISYEKETGKAEYRFYKISGTAEEG